jgi:N-acyl amino acid synthase of PEP-CTERM/exosortase system
MAGSKGAKMNTSTQSVHATTYNNKDNFLFETVPAKNDDLVRLSYRLRYQVYCIENQFEDPAWCPNHEEFDEYDSRSVHSLLRVRNTNKFIGSVRLILPDQDNSSLSFPIQQHCRHSIFANIRQFHLKKPAEISRFCISKELKAAADQMSSSPGNAHNSRNLASEAILGLMQAIIEMCIEHRVTDMFAIMEPSLLRLLARLGIYFRPIGELVPYHGMRQPCHIEANTLLDRLKNERYDVWRVMTRDGSLHEQFHPIAMCG